MLQTSNKSSGSSLFACLPPTLLPYITLSSPKGLKSFCFCFLLQQQQGYVLGNPVTDFDLDNNTRVPFVHGMALISDDLYEVTNYKIFCLSFCHK